MIRTSAGHKPGIPTICKCMDMSSPDVGPSDSPEEPGTQPPGPAEGAPPTGDPGDPGQQYGPTGDPRYQYGWPGYDQGQQGYQGYQQNAYYGQGYPGYPGGPYPPQYPWGYDPSAPYGRAPNGEPYSDKQKVVAGLLQIFLGGVGAGRWYLGDTGIALAQLFTCGGLGIWALIDGIMILTGNVRDKYGRPLRD